jgi:hypothetical protein
MVEVVARPGRVGQGDGIIMEGCMALSWWLALYGDQLRLAGRDSDSEGVICTLMDGPYRLPCRAIPVALTGVAQLLADGISSSCYIVNDGRLSMLTAPRGRRRPGQSWRRPGRVGDRMGRVGGGRA